MSVAPVLDQRKVEDCPASIVEGSAVKLLITGAAACGGGATVGGGGGGGGGGGTFLAQPTANNTSTDSNRSMPVLDACNLELSLILKSPLLVSWSVIFFIVLLYSKQVFRCSLAL
jgi:hypothetical protein